MSAAPDLNVINLSKRYGGLVATDDLSLTVHPGEIHALIGPNGAGKTTLIKQLAGEIAPSAGKILFQGRDITGLSVDRRALAGMARTYQITSLFEELTVFECVSLAVIGRQRKGLRFWRSFRSDRRLVEEVERVLELSRLTPVSGRRVDTLAYGVKRQVEIAIALAMQPRVLLLDEPMAGMSKQESEEIVRLIQGLAGQHSILLVEHDMDAVFRLADRITVLVYGKAVASGTVEAIRADPLVREAYLGDGEDA